MSHLQSDLRPIGRKCIPPDINSGRIEKVSATQTIIQPVQSDIYDMFLGNKVLLWFFSSAQSVQAVVPAEM